jgi:hypothetical protein
VIWVAERQKFFSGEGEGGFWGAFLGLMSINNIKAASLKSFQKGFQAAPEERMIFQDIQALVQPRVSYQSSPPPPVNSNLLGMNSFLS